MPDTFSGAEDSNGGSLSRELDSQPSDASQEFDLLLFRRYQVRYELGRGGMGVVLLADDTALGIPVAVKLVPDLVLKDTEAIADLRKEVRRGMALMHPGIVRTHNFERDEEGAGIVMEYVEGHTLTEYKQHQPEHCFDAEQILPWIEQLCAVLDYAHQDARIVHRDLKPRNVMIDMSGRLKVADFGIAATLGDSMSRSSMEGVASGTPSYMSPQQAQGLRPSHLDDIHALGATIYELLTSKAPFFQGSATSIFSQVLQAVPPSMGERRESFGIAGRAPIPLEWEETVAACLAKDPADRPQSAGEVLARLRGEECPPGPPVPVSRAGVTDVNASVPIGAPSEERTMVARTALPPVPVAVSRSSAWAWVVALFALALVAGGAYFLSTQKGNGSRNATTSRGGMSSSAATATKDAPFVNSLGMEFVPVPGTNVLFCRTETRVQDYAEYLKESGITPSKSDLEQGLTHPVVNVSWNNAKGFCAWLSKKDGHEYRLPTDNEWSCAVGIGDREDPNASPKEKHEKQMTGYPWGSQWPPPTGTGNFADSALKRADLKRIAGYQDGYGETAPVASFAANSLGIYDLSGNVWEWSESLYDTRKSAAVLRGGSWRTHVDYHLCSAFRVAGDRSFRNVDVGFRCVLIVSESPIATRVSAPTAPISVPMTSVPIQSPAPIAPAPKDTPYINSLGMEFMRVPGTNVLFCRWETRVKDYAAFIADSGYDMSTGAAAQTLEKDGFRPTAGNWRDPHYRQDGQHPVVCVSLNDAKAFCAWLSKKEGREYRIPTDREWSYASEIADRENPNALPRENMFTAGIAYPWGTQWPPPNGAGNFSDSAFSQMHLNWAPITEYHDGFAETAPVGSFPANPFGLYDLSGNVWEWCDTWMDGKQDTRVVRGGAWSAYRELALKFQCRNNVPSAYRASDVGFRCVLVLPGG